MRSKCETFVVMGLEALPNRCTRGIKEATSRHSTVSSQEIFLAR